MGKQEFLEKLRLALNGRVSPAVVTENINYYEDFINTEVRKGRSEEDVLAQLGDPRLIARTIVQTHGNGQDGKGRAADMSGNTRTYSEQSADDYGDSQGNGKKKRPSSFRLPVWLFGIVVLVVVALVVVGVLSLVFSVVSIMLPVILIVLAVAFVVKLFRDWLN